MVSSRTLALAAPFAVALVVIVNAWSGLIPGVAFWDTGEFQTVLPIMGTAHPTGYPTYVLLGFLGNILLTPIGEPAFRITVLSLVAVAIAAAATVLLVKRLTGSTIVGIASGLGLATTKRIAEAHGGRIEVESAGAGAGSRFSLVLPIEARAPLSASGDGEAVCGAGA